MKPEEYSERTIEIDGWPVQLITYKLSGKYHTRAGDLSAGATLARIVADTRQEAEDKATRRTAELLSRTKRRDV